MWNAREWLEDHLDDLTDQDLATLADGDTRLLRLSQATTVQTLDVEYLRETARVVAASKVLPIARAA